MRIDLSAPITQALFASLVDVSEARVSQLVDEGTLQRGSTGEEWLIAYCRRLREQAAGRDPDGDLAAARTRLANEQADRVAHANAIARLEYLPVAVIEDVLSRVARQMAAIFDSFVPELRKDCPELVGEALRIVEAKIARVRELAASIRIDTPDPQAEADAELGDDGGVEVV